MFWLVGCVFSAAFGGGTGGGAGVVAGGCCSLGSTEHDFSGGGAPLVHAVQDCCAQDPAVVDVGLSFMVVLGECSPGFFAVQAWCGAPFEGVLDICDCPSAGEEGLEHVEHVFLGKTGKIWHPTQDFSGS